MKKFSIAILLVISVLVCPFSASAQPGSIYSWTDENGVKHFSDMAPANVQATHQKIVPLAQSGINDDSAADTLNDEIMAEEAGSTGPDAPENELSYADQQRQAIAERRAADQKNRAERERICLESRDELARIEPSRRVFSTDEDGNTTRLDDEERVKMVAESKRQIAVYCD